MAKALTPIAIKNLKPGKARREIPDGGCRGLYLIVQPTGRTSWAVRYRFEGQPKKLTLGSLTLAEARRKATEALHELDRGNDPAALKFEAEATAEEAADARKRDTVEHLARQFIEQHVKTLRPASQRQAMHVLNDLVLPKWRGHTVHDIGQRDIAELVKEIAKTRPVMANRTLAHLSKFFNWLCGEYVLKASPCTGIKQPAKEEARDRVLTDDEIRALWNACDQIGYPSGPAIQLLLLTGQRRGEVFDMRRSEIAGDLWTLPKERTKNNKRHDIPLTAQAMAIIEAAPVIDGDYVFTAGGNCRLGNASHAKDKLDTIMQPKEPWTLHDLRRTLATGLQKLGVRLEVTEAVLNHTSGSLKGVAAIYQRHDYAAEKRDALGRWADYLEALVTGRETKVIALRR